MNLSLESPRSVHSVTVAEFDGTDKDEPSLFEAAALVSLSGLSSSTANEGTICSTRKYPHFWDAGLTGGANRGLGTT